MCTCFPIHLVTVQEEIYEVMVIMKTGYTKPMSHFVPPMINVILDYDTHAKLC